MQIAADLEIDWREIVSLNDLMYPYLVYPGQVLIIRHSNAQNQGSDTNEQGDLQIYTVQQGDHLMRIARAFDMDWMEIADLNDLVSPYTLTPGQQLLLPGTGDAPVSTQSDSPVSSSSDYSGTVYICQPGDFLYALARTFGVSWQSLASYNGITYPYIVYPGQEIRVP
jgi:peptidoglycan endopeptidase LytE